MWSDGMVRVSGRENGALTESSCFHGGKLSCLSCHSSLTSVTATMLSAWSKSVLTTRSAACDGDTYWSRGPVYRSSQTFTAVRLPSESYSNSLTKPSASTIA